MIEHTATKGYGYIKIEIYHNNKNIDFDSIREAYEQDIITLTNNEQEVLKEIQDEKPETLRNQIIDLIKEETENISIEDLKQKVRSKNPYVSEDIFLIEIKRLLEDGFIFEPNKNKLRWLG